MYSHHRRGGGNYYRSQRGARNGWDRSNQQETNGPVLKGPKRINRTWKRGEQKNEEDRGEPTKTGESADSDKVEAKATLDIEKDSEPAVSNFGVESNKIEIARTVTNDSWTPPAMRKVGANKLVLKKKHANTEQGSGGNSETTFEKSRSRLIDSAHNVGAYGVVRNKPPLPRSDASRDQQPPEKWKRVGSHKLVLKGEPVKKSVAAPDLDREGMKARGRNKLVSESRLEEEERLKETLKRKRMEAKKGQVQRVAQSRAKRVKLSEQSDTTDGVEKFTDFAYQQTSKKRRNMGLVRVASADAPICPTFLRGIPCTNAKCQKRHDVPVEAATPICSFFQRHGQCKKMGACPFRHIKVSSFAMICPSFSLLGYCEDTNCEMKHVRQPKPQIK